METHDSDFVEQLAALRAALCDQLPTPQLAVLVRLTARLRRSGLLSHCVQVGESAPDFDFVRADGVRTDGASTSFYSQLAKGPVVINFFRGLWCQYCRTEHEAYERVRPELEALGCTYLSISPQAIEAGSSPTLIYDRDNGIARRYGLVYGLEREELELFEQWGIRPLIGGSSELPLPATYLVGTDRTVAFQFVDADFQCRCCPEELVSEARRLVEQT